MPLQYSSYQNFLNGFWPEKSAGIGMSLVFTDPGFLLICLQKEHLQPKPRCWMLGLLTPLNSSPRLLAPHPARSCFSLSNFFFKISQIYEITPQMNLYKVGGLFRVNFVQLLVPSLMQLYWQNEIDILRTVIFGYCCLEMNKMAKYLLDYIESCMCPRMSVQVQDTSASSKITSSLPLQPKDDFCRCDQFQTWDL